VGYLVALTLSLVLTLQAAVAPAQGTPPAVAPSAQPADVVLANAHSFVLRDPKNQVGYRIYVACPQGYETGSKSYPVVYFLDADNAFALAAQAYRLLRVEGTTPDLVLVGIGYDLTGSARRIRRERDLTPTRLSTNPESGDAGAFLSFLADTVVPAVDARYRTLPTDRALFGHSLGGIFTLYALFERPDVFRRYIASSPSLWWDDAVILKRERQFSRDRMTSVRSVFMSVGSEEPADMHEFFKPFADAMTVRASTGLTFDSAVLSGETHLTSVSAGFLRGLRAVYR
jgi:predicted alpha/beta superfamily hydrolase